MWQVHVRGLERIIFLLGGLEKAFSNKPRLRIMLFLYAEVLCSLIFALMFYLVSTFKAPGCKISLRFSLLHTTCSRDCTICRSLHLC